MFEAKYYKDYNHNYMILESEDTGEQETYQRRLLASNKIEGLLRCSVRDVNGTVYFYYDISSKVSIENLYKAKEFSYEQLRDFFIQMDIIYRNLGQFFMDERGLIARPDCIYYDLSSGKYFGLYYPMKENTIENQYEELMDFFLSHINSKDQKLVDSMYQIYEMSENPNFLLTDALSVWDKPDMAVPDVGNIIENYSLKEKAVNEITVSEIAEESIDSFENITTPIGMSDENYCQNNTAAKKNKSSKYYGIFAIVSLAGMCSAGWIYFYYELTKKELMMIICCLAIMGLCFVFSLIQLMLSGKKADKKEQYEQELKYEIEDEFRDERPMDLQGVLDRNVNTAPLRKETQDGYGDTVFIDIRKQNMEYKLYALDKKNKKHIELTQFPFTIGKMAGCVDCVLMDDSISRLHARIERQDEKILLTDMNSTNGTYKNGLRMEPSETVELEPGDEVRFGKLNYCYR